MSKTKAQLEAEIRSLRAKVASISKYRLRAEYECEGAKDSRDTWFRAYMGLARKKGGRAVCKNCSYMWQQNNVPYCMKHRTKISEDAKATGTCGDFKT